MLFTLRVILVFFFFPAAGLFCCLSIPPRGLSSAVHLYAAAPRCFDYAQHDRIKKVCHSERSAAQPRNLVETNAAAKLPLLIIFLKHIYIAVGAMDYAS